MMKRIAQTIFAAALLLSGVSLSHADTQARQFVLNTGFGLFINYGDFAGTEGLNGAFDIALEPEYFFSEHTSLSFRFDATVGGIDSIHFGASFRYYFDIPNHPRNNLYLGAGFGGGVVFVDGDDTGFGDFAIPVFGWQYDIGEHFKIGSEISFNILFNGHDAAFATRLMPLVLKWAF
ncbi:MAG TPA: hypothetical protein DF383_11445 [Deltaproteobacteria bacterium]|nr:hypothetical protein [Deltaproteobacteria bacterium]